MKRVLLIGSAFLAATLASPALAQDSQAGQSSGSADDVVVTALRRATSINQTPLAVSALSPTTLRDAGVTDARALSSLVPNFALTQDSYDARIAIRGVTSANVTETGDPSSAFLVNGFYIGRPADMMGAFFDIDRIEVLRGPQGTLYGRNTTAGVVNVITMRPTSAFGGSVDARGGSLGTAGLTGVVNAPLGGGLGVRAALNYDRQGSSLREGPPSSIPLSPYRDEITGRLTLANEAGAPFDFVVRADYSHAGGVEHSFVDNSTANSNFFIFNALGVDPTYRDRSADEYRTLPYALQYPSERDDTRWGISPDLTYHFGLFDLTYLGGYRYTERDDLRNFRVSGSYNNPVRYLGKFKNWSHELRVSTGEGTRLFAQAGLYYFKEDMTIDYRLGAPFASNVGGANVVGYSIVSDPMISESKAAFGQVTYKITEALRFTAGLRYTEDHKERNGGVFFDVNDPATSVVTRRLISPYVADRDWEATTWKAGLDYDVDGLGLTYFNVSTGYKAGGFNDGCVAGQGVGCTMREDTLYYRPEKITAYEGGFKFGLADGALRWNLSIFHYDYEDLQLSQFATTATGGPTRLVQNAATAKVDGVESEFVFSPWENGRFHVSPAYTFARYDNFVPRLATGQSRDFHDLLLDHAPKWSGSAAYEHEFPLANGGDVTAHVLVNYSSAYYIADIGILGQYRNPEYTKTDVSLTYNAPSGAWYIQGFGKNLEDEITISHAGSGAFANATIGQPRTFGVRTGLTF